MFQNSLCEPSAICVTRLTFHIDLEPRNKSFEDFNVPVCGLICCDLCFVGIHDVLQSFGFHFLVATDLHEFDALVTIAQHIAAEITSSLILLFVYLSLADLVHAILEFDVPFAFQRVLCEVAGEGQESRGIPLFVALVADG